MTEETTEPTNTTEPTPTTPAPDSDPRNHPAFKAVLKQLEDARHEAQALKDAQDKAAKAAEQKRLEEEGNYKEALRLAQEEATTAKTEAERAVNKAKLALAGVHDPVHAEFLVSAYNNAEDKPATFDEWITTAKDVDSYKPFFGLADPPARQGLPGGDASPGAARSTTQSWAQVKTDLKANDLEKVAAAEKAVRDYLMEHGSLPPNF